MMIPRRMIPHTANRKQPVTFHFLSTVAIHAQHQHQVVEQTETYDEGESLETKHFFRQLENCVRMFKYVSVSVAAIKDITCTSIVCASIHLGGRFALPMTQANNVSNNTAPPVTMHTLAATVSGMIFGPKIGIGGALMHVLLWLYVHKGIGPSMGYVLGMIPCTGIAGWLLQQQQHQEPKFEKEGLMPFQHPPPFFSTFVIAVIAQFTTLSCGVSFLCVWNMYYKKHELEQNQTVGHVTRVSLKDVWMVGALPFVPGLIIKSILAWIFLSIIDRFLST